MEVATVMRKKNKKLIILLSVILMHQLTRVPTNEHGFLIQPITMGICMELNTVMKNKTKQLSLMWTIIVMHHLMRPPIKKSRLSAQVDYNGNLISLRINIWWCSYKANKLFCPKPKKAPILLHKAEFSCWKKLLPRMNPTRMQLSQKMEMISYMIIRYIRSE